MERLNPQNYIWEWERNMFPYYTYLMANGWLVFSHWPVYTVNICERGVANGYLEKKSLEQAAAKIVAKVKKTDAYRRNWEIVVDRTGRELLKFCSYLDRIDWPKLSDRQLKEICRLSLKKFYAHNKQVVMIRVPNRLIQSILLKNFDPTTTALLLSATKKSFFVSEHENLLRLAEKIKRRRLKRAELDMLINAHVQKYRHILAGFYKERPLTTLSIRKSLARLIKSRETLPDFQGQIRQAAARRKRLLRGLSLSPDLRRIIEFGALCTYFKDLIRVNCNRWLYSQRQIFKEIGRRTGKSWEVVASLSPEEVEGLINKPKRILPFRSRIFYSNVSGIQVVSGRPAQIIARRFHNYFFTATTKEITGTAANNGRVSGKILVIHHAQEAAGRRDYILVATMTTPDLMPAIRNARAVITDEGGLTCHATIIARELNLPCIIGTKIATKILHTGDLVEVNADKGIVKLIKPAKRQH
ncbi:MAG: PEP-utilizing enzyme [Patescibacteria group bacterium]